MTTKKGRNDQQVLYTLQVHGAFVRPAAPPASDKLPAEQPPWNPKKGQASLKKVPANKFYIHHFTESFSKPCTLIYITCCAI